MTKKQQFMQKILNEAGVGNKNAALSTKLVTELSKKLDIEINNDGNIVINTKVYDAQSVITQLKQTGFLQQIKDSIPDNKDSYIRDKEAHLELATGWMYMSMSTGALTFLLSAYIAFREGKISLGETGPSAFAAYMTLKYALPMLAITYFCKGHIAAASYKIAEEIAIYKLPTLIQSNMIEVIKDMDIIPQNIEQIDSLDQSIIHKEEGMNPEKVSQELQDAPSSELKFSSVEPAETREQEMSIG